MAAIRVNDPRVFCMVVSDGKAGLFLLMPSSSLAPEASVHRTRSAGTPAPRTARRLLAGMLGLLLASALVSSSGLTAAASLQSPEQFTGFKVGADNKLIRWDKIVEYMKLAAGGSDRLRLRELGRTTGGNPFLSVEISAPDTLRNLDRY